METQQEKNQKSQIPSKYNFFSTLIYKVDNFVKQILTFANLNLTTSNASCFTNFQNFLLPLKSNLKTFYCNI